jgi:predicted secreted protein
LRTFRKYRDAITDLEEEQLCQSEENYLDHAHLDSIAVATPSLDSTHMIRRGLSRMGSHFEFPSTGLTQGLGRQYSMRTGYMRVPSNRLIHGRRLSSVLEKSRNMDPSNSNIMEHILDTKYAEEPSLLKTTSSTGKTSTTV